jgi:hypothetical protein
VHLSRSVDGACGLGYANVERVVVDSSSAGTIYACNQEGIGKSIGEGETWETVYDGTATQLMVAPSRSTVLHAWTFVRLLRSVDGGPTWDERARTGLPPATAGEEYKLALVAGDSPGILYVYDVFGKAETSFYRSADGGHSWEPCQTGWAAVIGSAVSAPSDPSIVYAAGTLSPTDLIKDKEHSTGLMTSTDGGASWTYQRAPADILTIAVDAGESPVPALTTRSSLRSPRGR